MKRAAKGKGRIELNGRRFPVQAASGKKPIDSLQFIPVLPPGGRAAGPLKLIRRADLLPKTAPAATVGAFNNFGDLLVDIFNPTYGSHYPIGGRSAFIFHLARVSWIDHSMWKMQLAWNKYGYERFSFGIAQWVPRSYLRVQLGQTQGTGSGKGAIVGVRANSSQFYLDLSGRSYKFFDLILSETNYTVEFFLRSDINPRATSILEIQQVELYASIHTFPTEEILD